MSALQFSQTRDAEIAWVDGQLVREHLKSLTQGQERMDVDTFDSVPVLEQLPLTEVGLLCVGSTPVVERGHRVCSITVERRHGVSLWG